MHLPRLVTSIALTLSAAVSATQLGAPTRLDSRQPIPYFIAAGKTATGFQPADRQLATWAFEAWQRSEGGAIKFTAVDTEQSAIVRLYWPSPVEGNFGETQPITVAGQRGAAVYIRTDMSAQGPGIEYRADRDSLFRDTVVYLTCVHEIGHALGLAHTRDFADIMYFFGYGGDVTEYFARYRRSITSRADIAKTSGLSSADISRLRALYAKAD